MMESIEVWLGLLALCIAMGLWAMHKIRRDNAMDEWYDHLEDE